jgi:uncharacterized protein (UPF0332 family)
MSLTETDRKALVSYRLDKARSTFEDAVFVASAGRWNLAVNRLYYALFHAASALLLTKGFVTHTHKGVLVQMNLQFVKTGVLDKEDGVLLSQLFCLRQEADYEDFIEMTEEQVNDFIPRTRLLLDKIMQIVHDDSR